MRARSWWLASASRPCCSRRSTRRRSGRRASSHGCFRGRLPTPTRTSVGACSWSPARGLSGRRRARRARRDAHGRGLRDARRARARRAGRPGAPPGLRRWSGCPRPARRCPRPPRLSCASMAADYDAVVLGPGLTVADGAVATARKLVASVELPMVLDADGAQRLRGPRGGHRVAPGPDRAHAAPRRARPAARRERPPTCRRIGYPRRRGLAGSDRAVALKGAGTVVSGEGRQAVNTSGSVALATAGTGDVLAGMIGALLAQGRSAVRGRRARRLRARAGGRGGRTRADSALRDRRGRARVHPGRVG